MKILFVGDVVGKIGRKALALALPKLKEECEPDLVVVNIENLAHGKGVTAKTFDDVSSLGIDVYTGGNHTLDKPEITELFARNTYRLLRPHNLGENVPGVGVCELEVGSRKALIINLMGQVYIGDGTATNPFKAIDEILFKYKTNTYAAILVDLHAEVTSEKRAFAHYVDGRVSAVLGTHTHIPTADAHVMPGGTAYVTDVGMVGARDSVIGVVKEPVIADFVNGTKSTKEIPESGLVDIGAVLVEVDPKTGRALEIKRLDRTVTV